MRSSVAVTHPSPLRSINYLPWLTCISAAFFFFFEFMQVNMFNAITPYLMQEFSLSAVRIGQMSANYFYATLCFLFPAGMILDRFSTRKIILIAMGSSVLCTFIFACTHHIWAGDICRFITGLGGSFCFISCIRLAVSWFPPKRLALIVGLIVTIAMFGGMLAQTPMTLLTDSLGWRKMLFLDGLMGIVILIVISIFVHDAPLTTDLKIKTISRTEFIAQLKHALLNSQNWLGGLYTSLLNLPILLLGAMWGGLYLVQIHHLTRTQSSLVTSMIFAGMMIGSPLLGWISDRIGRRRSPMIICAIFALIFILCIMLIPHLSFYALASLFFGLGFFTSAQILSYPLITESNPKALIGTAEGVASTLVMGGGIPSPFLAH